MDIVGRPSYVHVKSDRYGRCPCGCIALTRTPSKAQSTADQLKSRRFCHMVHQEVLSASDAEACQEVAVHGNTISYFVLAVAGAEDRRRLVMTSWKTSRHLPLGCRCCEHIIGSQQAMDSILRQSRILSSSS